MQEALEFIVRGRCVCGRRYRILHARAGTRVDCPQCGRPIVVSDTAVARAVAAAHQAAPATQPAAPTLLEAEPVDCGELRLAPVGSRIGLTGHRSYSHAEAMLAAAMGPASASLNPADAELDSLARESRWTPQIETAERPFWLDALASFYLAGRVRNLLNLVAISVVVWLLAFCSSLLPTIIGFIVNALVSVVLLLYMIQFLWSVMGLTANGEDEMPLAQSDWNWWEDSLRPAFWMIVISLVCSIPWIFVVSGLGAAALQIVETWIVLAAGWFFWPVMVMAIGTGGSYRALRPDLLLRAIYAVGPSYLLVCALALLLAASLVLIKTYLWVLAYSPIVGLFVHLYIGYVLFRTLGLVHRHYQSRLPWGF